MALLDTFTAVGSLGLGIAAFLAACLSYVVFTVARRASAALAGVAAGLVVGTLLGAGVPAFASALVGGVGGFIAADRHPRGGTVAVAVGASLSAGLLAAVAVTGSLALGTILPLGVGVAVGLAALGWRFPRVVDVPGLSAVVGIVALVGPAFASRSVDALADGVLVGAPPLAADQVPYLLVGPVAFLLAGVVVQALAAEYAERLAPLLPGQLRGHLGAADAEPGSRDEALPPCPECGASRDPGLEQCPACGAATDADASGPADHDDESLDLEGLARLGAAVMLADGQPSRAEAEWLTDVLSDRFEDRASSEIQETIKRAGKSEPALDAVLADLAGSLGPAGRRAALEVAVEVAQADGKVTEEEAAAVTAVEAAFDLEDRESVPSQQYVNPTD